MDKKVEVRQGDLAEDIREVKRSRRRILVLVGIFVGILTGVGVMVALILLNQPVGDGGEVAEAAEEEPEPEPPHYYSPLTGEEVESEALTYGATFCVQVPNGTDGARPQAGLDRAGVIFEAIAESGITRFAAIFQNVEEIAAIGPMRSLRLYYLQWDTPFDCTIVHDGGEWNALQAVKQGYRDFTRFGGYVWRSNKTAKLNRKWNNEFTSGELLLKFNNDRGYGATSNVVGFTRRLPDEEVDEVTEENAANVIRLRYGRMPNYNPVYRYDAETDKYLREYESGMKHTVYDCAGQSGKITPESVCTETQLAPSVVVAMVVAERKAADNYHEDITTIGSGKAYIFQSGTVTEATWSKPSVGEQIKFFDAEGAEIRLVAGQAIVSAVPQSGGVSWE